jgi:hypothetical protein
LSTQRPSGCVKDADLAAATDCIDGVEQLTRYLELLNRDPLLTSGGPVRGIACAVVDYDALRGLDNAEDRLF